jgi:AraC-like DNA-binding protein
MIFNYILFTGAALMILFSIHLITTIRGNLFLNRLLGINYLARAILNIFFLTFSQTLTFYPSFVFGLIPVISFIAPVLCYFYVKGFINDESKFKKTDWLHFIPAVLVLIIMLPFFVSSTSDQQAFINNFNDVKLPDDTAKMMIPLRGIFLIRSLVFLIYMFFSWKIFIVAIKNKSENIISVQKNWLAFFLSITTIFHISTFIVAFYVTSNAVNISDVFDLKEFCIISTVLMLLFISYPILKPVVLFGHLIVKIKTELPNVQIDDNIITPTLTESVTSDVPKNTLLTEAQIHFYEKLFEDSMQKDKYYLDPELTMSKFSELLNIPKHHCSYFLNQTLNKSFRTYINHYRIKYFLEIHAKHSKELTNEALSAQVGFNNRATFNTAFKKETGFTPTEYFSLNPHL